MTEKKTALKITKRLTLKASYDEVFNSPAGKVVLDDLLKNAGVSKFQDHKSMEALWINQGERRLVFSILTFLGRDSKYILDQAEQNNTQNYEKQI